MSELRDVATAMRATSKRLDTFAEAMTILLRDSGQQAEWRHQQRNEVAIREGLQEAQLDQLDSFQRALKQMETFSASLWKYLGKLDERLELLATTRHEDVSELKRRLRALEPTEEEVTKA